MKIKFNVQYAYSFNGIDATVFKKDHVYDVSNVFGALMLEKGYAVSAQPEQLMKEDKKAAVESVKSATTPEPVVQPTIGTRSAKQNHKGK